MGVVGKNILKSKYLLRNMHCKMGSFFICFVTFTSGRECNAVWKQSGGITMLKYNFWNQLWFRVAVNIHLNTIISDWGLHNLRILYNPILKIFYNLFIYFCVLASL